MVADSTVANCHRVMMANAGEEHATCLPTYLLASQPAGLPACPACLPLCHGLLIISLGSIQSLAVQSLLLVPPGRAGHTKCVHLGGRNIQLSPSAAVGSAPVRVVLLPDTCMHEQAQGGVCDPGGGKQYWRQCASCGWCRSCLAGKAPAGS